MRRSKSGFTITELLITVALIAVLLGFLLPALGGVWSQGAMTKSMSSLKQIATWMQLYSTDNTDHVLPAQFDYTAAGYKGQVRSTDPPPTGEAHSGTWSDILQSGYVDDAYAGVAGSLGTDYRDDSPDRPLYDLLGESDVQNHFRSAAKNTRNARNRVTEPRQDPLPFGPGADEAGYPGLFAANAFFDAGFPGAGTVPRFFTNGQIRVPDQSMYLVDSWAGEVIAPYGENFDPADRDGDGLPDWQVDFRYGSDDNCLMLFLDGHAAPQGPWQEWGDVTKRNIRIARLDTRQARMDFSP
jgi:prepilin-type N-terminal cleavage/methylation domain-containing protein